MAKDTATTWSSSKMMSPFFRIQLSLRTSYQPPECYVILYPKHPQVINSMGRLTSVILKACVERGVCPDIKCTSGDGLG
jgi:hypothetical protein